MSSNDNPTTIRVTKDTKERLRKRGSKGDTYEDIVVELLKVAEKAANNST